MRDELIAGLEQLAEDLLGPPSIRKPRSWRWGAKGAFVLEMLGRKRGAWHDKDSEKGGGPFHLIAHGRSCPMAEAIAWAREWTGGTPNIGRDFKAEQATRQAERDRKAQEHAAEDARDAARRIGLARQLWAHSGPITGSVAERYLFEFRGISALVALPDAVRFHQPTCSLIVGATLADGTLGAVQRVRLTSEAQKAAATPENPVKVTNGVLAGAVVRLAGAAEGPLLLAEGPETGLSVWAATGHETWVALGGMAGMTLPANRRVVACRDDDPKHSPGDRKMVRAVEAWRAAGHQIAVATPWPSRAYDKTDFNDTLQRQGSAGVRRRVEAALQPGGTSPARLPIKQVREQLRPAVAGFFNEVRTAGLRSSEGEDPQPDGEALPPVHAIKTDVGSGKTLATYAEAMRLLVEMRATGDNRCAAIAVPTHRLADEQAAIFDVDARGTGLVAAVWRGMSAQDPDSPGSTMCLNLGDVEDAREAHLDVFRSTCRRKLDDGRFATCPFFSQCGYQRQRESSADLWIIPHDLLFLPKPATVGKLAFLVVDESIWSGGLEGVHGRPLALSIDAFSQPDRILGGDGLVHHLDTDRLHYLRNRMLDVLRPLDDGPVPAEALIGSALTLENTKEAYELEYRRCIEPHMVPGMAKAARREAVQAAAANATIMRIAGVWKAITALLEDGGPIRSGWIALATQPSENGPVRVLHLKRRRPIGKGWQVPTLLLDATMNVELLRPYWPQLLLTAELLADAPHQTIRQVVDRAYAKSAIEPLTEDDPFFDQKEAQRRQRGLRTVHAIVNREARRFDGQPVLVVAQKTVREALPSFGPMAPAIELAHHNAVSGRDEWRGVRALIVVGRTQPAPGSVERLAEALTGRAVDGIEGWYRREDAVRHADGKTLVIEADRHPDPICEAIRWQICEGELVQIIGRARGVNRTEANPVDVLVLTDVPLPLPITTTLQAADLAPSPADLMLAAGGVVFENPTDAACAYPHLWQNRDAAKKAFQRARPVQLGTFPYKVLLLGECPQLEGEPVFRSLRRLNYQRAGARLSPAVAWIDPDLVGDAPSWLAERLGSLSWCLSQPTGPPSRSPPLETQSLEEPPMLDEPASAADVGRAKRATADTILPTGMLDPSITYPRLAPGRWPISPIVDLVRLPGWTVARARPYGAGISFPWAAPRRRASLAEEPAAVSAMSSWSDHPS